MVNQYIIEKRQTAESVINMHSVWKVMKLVITFCLALTLLVGCSGEPNWDDPKVREKILAEAIDADNLQTRKSPSGEELGYAPNQEQPYTGWVKTELFDDPILIQVQHGKANGIYIEWHSDHGQIRRKGTLKNGKGEGLWTWWHDNGQKEQEGTYKNNEQEGLWIEWDENGQEVSRKIYKDGKVVP